jgi:O-acetyl-ADP-ribose deacetylase (regulator of RNase III)
MNQSWFDRVEIVRGDITQMVVDAIVNAANQSLMGGGGVDGAIHRAAGPELLKECVGIGGCETSQAVITQGYRLPARHVIHTVGPVWYGGQSNEDDKLASCYRRCFALVEQHDLRSVAFPCISTGAYRFPADRAAGIALTEMRAFLERNTVVERVVVVCFMETDQRLYQAHLENMK